MAQPARAEEKPATLEDRLHFMEEKVQSMEGLGGSLLSALPPSALASDALSRLEARLDEERGQKNFRTWNKSAAE